MSDVINQAFLTALGSTFGCYGIRQLVMACRIKPFSQWAEKALLGAGAVILGGLFLSLALRFVGST